MCQRSPSRSAAADLPDAGLSTARERPVIRWRRHRRRHGCPRQSTLSPTDQIHKAGQRARRRSPRSCRDPSTADSLDPPSREPPPAILFAAAEQNERGRLNRRPRRLRFCLLFGGFARIALGAGWTHRTSRPSWSYRAWLTGRSRRSGDARSAILSGWARWSGRSRWSFKTSCKTDSRYKQHNQCRNSHYLPSISKAAQF
jgi:hypothetical protein